MKTKAVSWCTLGSLCLETRKKKGSLGLDGIIGLNDSGEADFGFSKEGVKGVEEVCVT